MKNSCFRILIIFYLLFVSCNNNKESEVLNENPYEQAIFGMGRMKLVIQTFFYIASKADYALLFRPYIHNNPGCGFIVYKQGVNYNLITFYDAHELISFKKYNNCFLKADTNIINNAIKNYEEVEPSVVATLKLLVVKNHHLYCQQYDYYTVAGIRTSNNCLSKLNDIFMPYVISDYKSSFYPNTQFYNYP